MGLEISGATLAVAGRMENAGLPPEASRCLTPTIGLAKDTGLLVWCLSFQSVFLVDLKTPEPDLPSPFL